MSSTQTSTDAATPGTAVTALPLRLEVLVLPVADVGRSKRFYQGLGWRIDADIDAGDFQAVQMTPPASPASVIFGKGVTDAEPGSLDRAMMVVDDIEKSRAELIEHGADVSEIYHDARGGLGAGLVAGTEGRAPGPDPQRQSYASYADFRDPDGNRWLLQEITERLPGRV